MAPQAALLALALAAVSPSRLGVVVRGDDETSRALLAACPRLAVFPLPGGLQLRAGVGAVQLGERSVVVRQPSPARCQAGATVGPS